MSHEHTVDLTEKVIGAAIEVHRWVGPGLLESAYLECLCYELSHSGMDFRKQVPLPMEYKDLKLSIGYRLDLLVEGQLVVEIKTVEKVMPVHKAQLLTYMKLCKSSTGLLLNFNVPYLVDGVCRMVI